MFQHDLGLTARDKITGFGGVIVSRIDHITGCDQYFLQPKVDEKGAAVEGRWFDDNRLDIVGSEKLELETSKTNPDRKKDGPCASHPGKG